MPSSRERGSGPDLIGAAVLVCCALWAMIAAAGRPARPEGELLALLAVAAGYATGRIAGALLPVAGAAMASAGVTAVVLAMPRGLSGEPMAPPLGYANANAALLTLAAGAACCSAWASRSSVLRLLLRLLTVALAGICLAIGSVTGCVVALGVLLCSLAAAHLRRRPLALCALALCAAVAVGGTVAVATSGSRGGTALAAQLTEERVALWADAADLVRQNPVRGAGPDRFKELSPAARTDPDHLKARSAVLQQAAEQGLPGAALLGVAYLWMLYALWRSPRPTPVVVTAGAALTGLAVQASLDYVLSFAAVTVGAGLLAGLATAHPLVDDPAQGWGDDRGDFATTVHQPAG